MTRAEENERLVRQFFDRLNQGDLDVIDELVGDSPIEHDQKPADADAIKPAMRGFHETMRAAFPDFSMNIRDVFVEGDKVGVVLTMEGTHQGSFIGAPGSGKRMSIRAIDTFRVKDGRLHEHWGVTDVGGMLEQLGLPMPS